MRTLRTCLLPCLLLLAVACTDNVTPHDPVVPPPPPGPGVPPPPPPPPPAPSIARWSDSATWAPLGIPALGDDVVIPAGKEVLLDVTPPHIDQLRIAGTLRVSDSTDLALWANEILVEGRFEVGTESAPHQRKFVITLSEGSGSGTTVGTKVLGVLPGGVLEMHGQPRLGWTRLATTAMEGTRSLTLLANHDWKVGDRIVVASTDFDPNHAEELVVAGGSGNTVTFEQGLQYRHWGQLQQYAGRAVDERAEVGLLTRNIKIQGDSTSYQGFGGHVLTRAGGSMRVEGVELYLMGQAGSIGRYPLHWHMAGSVTGQYARNNAIWRTNQRCITIHGTDNAVVSGNVCYDHGGHGYFLEDGAESGNTLDHNLGLKSRIPPVGVRLLASDDQPATFWITNPDNTITNNAAAGSVGFGFWYALPASPTGLSTGEPDAPRYTPLGVFRANVAHSNRRPGLQVDQGPRPDGTTETTSYNPRIGAVSNGTSITAVFEDFVGWKHNGRAVWLRGTNHRLRGAVLADNMIGATFASNDSYLEESLVVGESANVTAVPNPTFPIRGYEFYDGTVGADHVTFVNFMSNGQRPASALGYNRSNGFAISTFNAASALTLMNANGVYLEDPNATKDGDKAALFRDLDGSVTGALGKTVVANQALLYTPACTYRSEWNSWVCPHTYAQLQVQSGTTTPVAPLTATRDGLYPTTFVGVPNAPTRAYLSVITGHAYQLQWNGAAPERPRFVLTQVSEGDRIRVDFPYAGVPGSLIRDYQTNTPLQVAGDLAQLDAADGDRWYRDGATGVISLMLHVRAGRTYTTVEVRP
ncbi:MAG TPA: G8 domain-containing protein [Gemmatimonadales bacterium]|nr:G8 domain-containing protein [Gemmatimonadales bacterium]